MGVIIKGTDDTVKAADGSLSIEGFSIKTTGIGTFDGGIQVGSAATIHSNGNAGFAGIVTANGGLVVKDVINLPTSGDLAVGVSTFIVDYSAGRVGIKTEIPGNSLDVKGGGINFGDAAQHSGSVAKLEYGGNTGVLDVKAHSTGGNTQIAFYTALSGTTAEKFRIDNNGRLLIGKTTGTDAGYGTNNCLQVEGVTAETSSIQLKRNSNDTNGPYLYLGKSRGTSVDSDTVVQNGDEVGSIVYHGTDGTDANNVCARIVGAIDGAPGSNDLPGRLMFMTTADGAGDSTERMRIDCDGYITQPSKRSAAFCARQNTGNSSLSADDIVILNGMSDNWHTFDPGDNYNTSTGKYTAPVAGVYWFEAQAMTTGWSNGDTTQDLLAIESNNGLISYPRQRRSYFRSDADANGYYTSSVAGMTLLAAGDTVWFKVTRACGVSNSNYSYFQGFLVG